MYLPKFTELYYKGWFIVWALCHNKNKNNLSLFKISFRKRKDTNLYIKETTQPLWKLFLEINNININVFQFYWGITILYILKVCSVMIWSMYVLWNDSHNKGNSYLSLHTFVCLCGKMLKIYSLNKFQVYNTVLLTLVIMLFLFIL